jgi:hypothetical protein
MGNNGTVLKDDLLEIDETAAEVEHRPNSGNSTSIDDPDEVNDSVGELSEDKLQNPKTHNR